MTQQYNDLNHDVIKSLMQGNNYGWEDSICDYSLSSKCRSQKGHKKSKRNGNHLSARKLRLLTQNFDKNDPKNNFQPKYKQNKASVLNNPGLLDRLNKIDNMMATYYSSKFIPQKTSHHLTHLSRISHLSNPSSVDKNYAEFSSQEFETPQNLNRDVLDHLNQIDDDLVEYYEKSFVPKMKSRFLHRIAHKHKYHKPYVPSQHQEPVVNNENEGDYECDYSDSFDDAYDIIAEYYEHQFLPKMKSRFQHRIAHKRKYAKPYQPTTTQSNHVLPHEQLSSFFEYSDYDDYYEEDYEDPIDELAEYYEHAFVPKMKSCFLHRIAHKQKYAKPYQPPAEAFNPSPALLHIEDFLYDDFDEEEDMEDPIDELVEHYERFFMPKMKSRFLHRLNHKKKYAKPFKPPETEQTAVPQSSPPSCEYSDYSDYDDEFDEFDDVVDFYEREFAPKMKSRFLRRISRKQKRPKPFERTEAKRRPMPLPPIEDFLLYSDDDYEFDSEDPLEDAELMYEREFAPRVAGRMKRREAEKERRAIHDGREREDPMAPFDALVDKYLGRLQEKAPKVAKEAKKALSVPSHPKCDYSDDYYSEYDYYSDDDQIPVEIPRPDPSELIKDYYEKHGKREEEPTEEDLVADYYEALMLRDYARMYYNA